MSDITITAKVKTLVGALVLDLSAANGYQLAPGEMPDRQYRRTVATSDDVEGDVEQQAVLASGIWVQPLRVVGSSTSEVETRRAALLAAVDVRAWLWEVTIDGTVRTWRASRADSSTGLATNDLVHFKRPVVLQIPVQPRTNEELA